MNIVKTPGFKKYVISFAELKKLPYGFGVTKIDTTTKEIEYYADYFKEDGELQDLDDVELREIGGVLQAVNLYKERLIEAQISTRAKQADPFDPEQYTI